MVRKFLAIGCIAGLLAGCSDGPTARRVLEDAGYSDITTTGYSFWSGCSQDETVATGFKAKSPGGKYVTGTVCGHLMFGGSHIRID